MCLICPLTSQINMCDRQFEITFDNIICTNTTEYDIYVRCYSKFHVLRDIDNLIELSGCVYTHARTHMYAHLQLQGKLFAFILSTKPHILRFLQGTIHTRCQTTTRHFLFRMGLYIFQSCGGYMRIEYIYIYMRCVRTNAVNL